MFECPICLPCCVEIRDIIRLHNPEFERFHHSPDRNFPIPIDISVGTYNYYLVIGKNLDKIVSVKWYPLKQIELKFTMAPWRVYPPNNERATFGITVLTQNTFSYQRAGSISFRVATGEACGVSAATYTSYPWSFNPLESPLQGWDTGYQEGGGGAF